jgi:hypothetical protein
MERVFAMGLQRFGRVLSRVVAGAAGILAAMQGPASAQDHAAHAAGGSMRAGNATCRDPEVACANAAMPFLAADGTLWLVWSAGGAVSVAKSADMGKSFGPRREIGRHESALDTGADARPQILGDGRGNLVVAYAFFRDKNWNAQVNVSTSADNGASFSPPRSISDNATSQRFASLAADSQGRIFATWIDKRLVAADAKSGRKRQGGAIAYAWSEDGGRSFVSERIAHEDSCECCRIGVALTPAGMPALLYRAIYGGKVRDHATQVFASREAPGKAQRVAEDNWVTDSCPHHGPSLTVSEPGTLHAAWFTQGTARSGAFYARSTDAGARYSEPVRIGSAQALAGRPYLLARGAEVWLVWKEFDGKEATVLHQKSADDGKSWSAPVQLARTTGYSDHPMLVAHAGKVYLSWLTRTEGYRLIEIGGKS